MLDLIAATRYVTPLREGGSLPGIMEADDLGTYAVKFSGAGQGPKVLVAEVIVSGLAHLLEIPTPRLAVIDVAPAIARYEADEEVQDLLNASPGLNLAVDFLPGAFGYDGSRSADPDLAERILWLDAFSANVDRTWNNPNLLVWHRQVYAIDHGAALYFHHSWPRREPNPAGFAAQPFALDHHVLRDLADPTPHRHGWAADRLDPGALAGILRGIPDAWLETTDHLPDAESVRLSYLDHLLARLAQPARWWRP